MAKTEQTFDFSYGGSLFRVRGILPVEGILARLPNGTLVALYQWTDHFEATGTLLVPQPRRVERSSLRYKRAAKATLNENKNYLVDRIRFEYEGVIFLVSPQVYPDALIRVPMVESTHPAARYSGKILELTWNGPGDQTKNRLTVIKAREFTGKIPKKRKIIFATVLHHPSSG